jgi:hypothetical protein
MRCRGSIAILDIPVVFGTQKHQRVKTFPIGLLFKDEIFAAVSHTAFPIVNETLSNHETAGMTNEELFLFLIFQIAKI